MLPTTANIQETQTEQLLLKVTEVIAQNLHADSHRKLKAFSRVLPVPAGEESLRCGKSLQQVIEKWS